MRRSIESFSAPDLLQLEGRRGQPSEKFGRLYTQLIKQLNSVFSADKHWKYKEEREPMQTPRPPADPKAYLQVHNQSDYFSRRVAEELWTVLRDKEKARWKLPDRGITFRPTQRAHATWMSANVARGEEGMAKLLGRGDFGVGKTLAFSGVFNEAFRNYQIREAQRGEDFWNNGFLALKINAGLQNFAGDNRFLDQPPYNYEKPDIKLVHETFGRWFGSDFYDYFLKSHTDKVWSSAFTSDIPDYTMAKLRVQDLVGFSSSSNGADKFEEFMSMTNNAEEIVETLVSILTRTHRIIAKSTPDGTPRLLATADELDQVDTEDRQLGDAFYSYPLDHPFQAGQRAFVVDPDHDFREPAEDLVETTMLMLRANMFGSKAFDEDRWYNAQGVANLGALVLDEAVNLAPHQIDRRHEEAGGDGNLLIVASTGSENQRKGWVQSPMVDERLAVRLGIRKPKGASAFPGVNGLPNGITYCDERVEELIGDVDWDLHLPGTEMACRQALAWHFRHVESLEKKKLAQPHMRNTMMFVPAGEPIREYAYRLENIYRDIGIPAVVVCYDGKSGKEQRWIEDWLNRPYAGYVKLVVISDSLGAKSISPSAVQNLQISSFIRNRTNRQQAGGRLGHGQIDLGLEDGQVSDNRLLLSEQVFDAGLPLLLTQYAQDLGITSPDTDETEFAWPDCQSVDQKQYEEDKKSSAFNNKHEILIPAAMSPSDSRKQKKARALKDDEPLKITNPASKVRIQDRTDSKMVRELKDAGRLDEAEKLKKMISQRRKRAKLAARGKVEQKNQRGRKKPNANISHQSNGQPATSQDFRQFCSDMATCAVEAALDESGVAKKKGKEIFTFLHSCAEVEVLKRLESGRKGSMAQLTGDKPLRTTEATNKWREMSNAAFQAAIRETTKNLEFQT